MIGPDGIVGRLQKKGWKVRKLQTADLAAVRASLAEEPAASRDWGSRLRAARFRDTRRPSFARWHPKKLRASTSLRAAQDDRADAILQDVSRSASASTSPIGRTNPVSPSQNQIRNAAASVPICGTPAARFTDGNGGRFLDRSHEQHARLGIFGAQRGIRTRPRIFASRATSDGSRWPLLDRTVCSRAARQSASWRRVQRSARARSAQCCKQVLAMAQPADDQNVRRDGWLRIANTSSGAGLFTTNWRKCLSAGSMRAA